MPRSEEIDKYRHGLLKKKQILILHDLLKEANLDLLPKHRTLSSLFTNLLSYKKIELSPYIVIMKWLINIIEIMFYHPSYLYAINLELFIISYFGEGKIENLYYETLPHQLPWRII